MKRFLQSGYIFLIFALLYAPIAVLIIFSFNDEGSLSEFTKFSFVWYQELFNDEEALTALKNSLILAILSSVIATVIGTFAALGLHHMRKKFFKGAIKSVPNVPMMIGSGVSVICRSDDVSADDFNKLISSFRNMGSIRDAKVHEMLRESAAESAEDATSAAAIALTPVSSSPIVFTGDLQAFLRYVGPFCKNYVNSITKSARNKHNGICEYCGSKSVLDSAHRDGEDRPVIIQKILEAHFKKSENYYEVDILKFEKIFKDSHMPVEDHIFFLCKKCHTEYDRGTKITTADILAKRKP